METPVPPCDPASEFVASSASTTDYWAISPESLQKLDFYGCPFDLHIEITTPMRQQPDTRSYITSLERLQEAANETHMGYLNGWFPRAPAFDIGKRSSSRDRRSCSRGCRSHSED